MAPSMLGRVAPVIAIKLIFFRSRVCCASHANAQASTHSGAIPILLVVVMACCLHSDDSRLIR